MKIIVGICVFLISVSLYTEVVVAETCAGCPVEADPNDEHIRNILTKAVTLQNAKSNDEDVRITKIDKVKSQIVAGTKYTVDFLAEGEKSKKPYTCNSVILHQPWITPEPQVLEYKCTSKKSKRSVGGPKDVNPDELDQVKDLVQMGIETLDELDADDNKRVVLKIIDAKKQLVNGIMYDVSVEVKTTSCSEDGSVNEECLSEEVGPQKICKLQIYRSFADKSPHNAKVVKSECDSTKNERSVEHHDHEQTNLEYINKVAQYATKMVNEALNSITVKGLINVVESDHLAGAHRTSLTLELGDTNCTKRGDVQVSECILIPEMKNHMVCTVNVVHDEKTDKMSVHSNGARSGIDCKNVQTTKTFSNRARRALVGGERPLKLSSDRLEDLKDFISYALTKQQDSVYIKKVASIISSSYQIMSGRVVKLLVEVADSDCFNVDEEEDEEECSLRNEGRLVCKMTIWEKPWLDSKELVSNECNPIEPTPELLGVKESDDNLKNFKRFTAQYNKAYQTVKELNRRFRIFRANMKKAEYLQATEQGTATYGATMFADLSSEEFKKHYLGLKMRQNSELQFIQKEALIPDIELPTEYDWRSYNIVTPVKNQGMCGSCWAFSVTGNVEGQYAIKTGQIVSLSEQELVDCDKYDSGCEGGLFDSAYHAIEEIGGLEGEQDYPYTGRDGKCHFDSSEVRVSISSSVNISHNETDMAKWLVANGPISIALNANAMQFYLGGVSHPLKFLCSPSDLDHGVLLVGYGVHKTWLLKRELPYWLIKNSWGPHWGHQGYYMLYRGDGACGVNQLPSSAVL